LPEADLLATLRVAERSLCSQTDPEAFFLRRAARPGRPSASARGCESRRVPEYALGHDERFGIWAALSERERRKLKRRAA